MAYTLAQLVSAEIRAEMARQQKQQVELGEYLGVKQPTVSRKLAGKASFRLDELSKIADFLGVDVRELLPKVAA